MEKEKVDYIFNHHSHLMTFKEKVAWKHWSTDYKIENGDYESSEQRERRRRLSYKTGWLTDDKEMLALLDDGIEVFKRRIAERIYKEEKVEFNNCPQCGKLTRTPKAKQCRYCGHDWH
ncbi:MAG: hypothetical protein ACFB15_29640 [Cyclobacteriaceae bacterium]